MTDEPPATPAQVEQAIRDATEEVLRARMKDIKAPLERENQIWRTTCESLVAFLDALRDSLTESETIDAETKTKFQRMINQRLGALVTELRGL